MKIQTISYKRVKNLGNYQSESLEASAEVEESEDPLKAFSDLRAWVLLQLDIDIKPNAEDDDYPY